MNIKKMLAVVLALVMIVCVLPMAFANSVPDAGDDPSDIDVPTNQLPVEDLIMYGDVDGDESVTLDDALAVMRFVADWDITISEDAADVDCDGDITLDDALAIMRFVADWDIVLGPTE